MDELLSLFDEDQRKYNILADRILQSAALTRDEELGFYDLHFKFQFNKYRPASELVRSYREIKE